MPHPVKHLVPIASGDVVVRSLCQAGAEVPVSSVVWHPLS